MTMSLTYETRVEASELIPINLNQLDVKTNLSTEHDSHFIPARTNCVGDCKSLKPCSLKSYCNCGGDPPRSIKSACSKIQRQIDSTNVFETLKFAKLIGDNNLLQKSQNYLKCNFETISKGNTEFVKLDFDEISALVDSDQLEVKSEEVVWEAVLLWVNFKKDYRQYKISDLLHKIRTGFLSKDYFREFVKGNELVAKSISCTPVINATDEFFKFGKISTQLISTPNVTLPRTGYHSSEVLFTFGGISEDDQLDDYLIVEFYDNKTNRWIRIDQYEEPRAYNGTIAMGYEVALIGGCYCGAADSLEYLNSCKAFDTISKTWRDLAQLEVHRGFVSAALLGKYIYALGGVGVNKHVLKSVEQYDIEQNQWTTVTPMNVKRAQACATALKDKLFVMGGWNEQDWLSSVESYDASTNQWTVLCPMQQVRAGASCVTYHNQVHVIGGYNGEEVASSGEKYEPESDTWIKIPDMFEPLSEFSMTVFQDKIFCVGGEKCEENVYFLTDDVICFDALTHQWKKMMRMSVPRHALSACVVKFPCLNGCESS